MSTHRTDPRRPRLPGRPGTGALALTLAVAVLVALLPLLLPAPDAPRPVPPDSAGAGADPLPEPGADGSGGPGGADGPSGPDGPANVVLVVLDDFSTELVRTMPHLSALQERAASYRHSYVVNSLCCPSRAATFTGLPPHLNGVLTNTSGGPFGALGGYPAFVAGGNEERSYNVAVDDAGYRTGFVGKYLNEYEPPLVGAGVRTAPPLVPGWDDFRLLSGGAYQGWGFLTTRRFGDELALTPYDLPDRTEPDRVVDRTYAGEVAADEAMGLLRRYERREDPWLLHVAPYGTHARTQPTYPGEPLFPPALRDRPGRGQPGGNCGLVDCADLSVADLPGYADLPDDNVPFRIDAEGVVTPAETWRTEPFVLTEERGSELYRQRAQMAQSIDRMIGRMVERLGERLRRDTYLVVTSDNGFHLGQHSLNGGKGLPYDSDSRVPLIVAGPGVVAGERNQVVSNLDLAPTIEELAGLGPDPDRAGTSFARSLTDPGAPGGRYAFMEHTYGPTLPGEPDGDLGSGGRLDVIPSFTAVRSAEALLVRVDLDDDLVAEDVAWELYRYDAPSRPWEDVNVFATDHDLPYARDLRRRLERWIDCEPRRCRRLTR